jgi:hypothetical protein
MSTDDFQLLEPIIWQEARWNDPEHEEPLKSIPQTARPALNDGLMFLAMFLTFIIKKSVELRCW